ncbi:MAG: PD40 domain-containing protein [Anaerolineae bacterium]|nr:PD40 domain-containing protein [Anaerolineae bacterium]MBL8105854.1 PD40 domain-containing protein [Anaerolineales bacterium]MCC7188505.1 PD40 domain-containing protein [Anaerolineales bacterium]
MLINKVISNKSNLYTLLALMTILVACKPVKTSAPITLTQQAPTATTIISTLTASTPTPTIAVTAPPTLIPSATSLSTPATPYPEEWLAFVDRKPTGIFPNTFISFIRHDGSGLFHPKMFEKFYDMVEYSLVWSPDGKYLLFDWSDFGPTMTRRPAIHVADPLQKKVTLVAANNAWVFPSWSPDSEWFATSLLTTVTNQEGKEQDTYNLFRVNSSTFQKDRITTSTSSDLFPSWSPDGKWIAFLRYTPESMTPKPGTGTECGRIPDPSDFYTGCIYADLYITRRDGSNSVLLLKSVYIRMDRDQRDSVYNNPSWSPDSKWLAVLTGSEQPDITLINIETGETRVLVSDPALDIYPVWSPDGSRLAFVSDREGNEEIYLISPDGSNLVNLTNNAGSDFNPVWSPSGRYIAFLSTRDGLFSLYVMNADGSNQTKAYEGLVYTRPTWFPLIGVDLKKYFGFGNE